MNKSYIMICKGCLIKNGTDPDRVGESCIAKSFKETCEICGAVQHGSWFKHTAIEDIKAFQLKRIKEKLNGKNNG